MNLISLCDRARELGLTTHLLAGSLQVTGDKDTIHKLEQELDQQWYYQAEQVGPTYYFSGFVPRQPH